MKSFLSLRPKKERTWRNGSRAGLRSQWFRPCGFESHRPHKRMTAVHLKGINGIRAIAAIVLLSKMMCLGYGTP